MSTQQIHSLRRQKAERPPAVRDHLDTRIDRVQFGLEMLEGDRDPSRYMTRNIFLSGSHVHHDCLTASDPNEQL